MTGGGASGVAGCVAIGRVAVVNFSGIVFKSPDLRSSASAGFTLIELIVMVAVAIAIVVVAGVQIRKAGQRAKAICCNCKLKQVGLAFKTWAIDHNDLFPMGLSTNSGGTLEYLETGAVFRHFQVMSNELSTPKVLVCPRDVRKFSTSFETNFSNANLSYFVGGLSNDTLPQMFLSGDRDLTGGVWRTGSILELTTNTAAGWAKLLHPQPGNIALADGSVSAFSASNLNNALQFTGAATNRLSIP